MGVELRRGWLLLSLAAMALPGCSSPGERVERSTRTVRSWEATVRTSSRQLAQGRIPRQYARQILHAAVAEERAQGQRPEWEAVSPELRQALDTAITRLASSLGEPPYPRSPSP